MHLAINYHHTCGGCEVATAFEHVSTFLVTSFNLLQPFGFNILKQHSERERQSALTNFLWA